jgi:hypothetical protein
VTSDETRQVSSEAVEKLKVKGERLKGEGQKNVPSPSRLQGIGRAKPAKIKKQKAKGKNQKSQDLRPWFLFLTFAFSFLIFDSSFLTFVPCNLSPVTCSL